MLVGEIAEFIADQPGILNELLLIDPVALLDFALLAGLPRLLVVTNQLVSEVTADT